MAVATGSQIRPELSAVDYTPFLQAAGQSAQMQAQGIAAGVGGALKGFESYVQQQKENKQLEAEVKSAEKLGQALQPFLAQVNPEAGAQVNTLLASVADPNVSLRERSAVAKNIGSALNNILNLAQLGKQTQDQKAAAEYAGLLRSGGGAIPAPISNAALSRFTPEQRLAGEEMFLRGEQTRVGIEETKAKTKALGVPKPQDLTFQEQAYNAIVQAEEAKQGFPLTPQQKADVFSRVSQMNRNLTNVTVGEGAATKVFTDLRGLQSNISALREVSSNYEDAINEITKSGAFSGPSGAIKYAGARALQLFGSDAFKSEAEAYQAAASAIANSVLAIARSLPGAASDKDVMFLERVAGGGERVASAETLKKLKERVERKLGRIQTEFNADLAAFGEQAKEGDQNIKFLYGILSGRNKSLQAKPSAQPAANETDQSIFDQADAIITR